MENNIEILFEDEAVIVINKPAGLIVHSDGRTEEPSVVDWVMEHRPMLKDVGEPWLSPQGESIPRPGIVHRLDRTTSGVLILAKTQEAFVDLKRQFQSRGVEKVYEAFVYGHNKSDEGIIEAEIGRSSQHPRRWSAQFGKKGNLRAAITHWKILGRFKDLQTGEFVMHMELVPKTGRTHQIRVHLKAIHHPIICDHLYAEGKSCILGFERPALHAKSISFDSVSGKVTVSAPYPADFSAALSSLQNVA